MGVVLVDVAGLDDTPRGQSYHPLLVPVPMGDVVTRAAPHGPQCQSIDSPLQMDYPRS